MKNQAIVYTFSLLLWSSFAFPCSFDDITNDCHIFNDSDKEKFDLPDGTFIPNFSTYIKNQKNVKTAQKVDDDQKRLTEWSRTNALNCLKVKTEIKRMSPDILDLPDCSILYTIFKKPETEDPKSALVAWPLDKPSDFKEVKMDELRQEFAKRTGNSWQKIEDLSDEARKFNAPDSKIYKSGFESKLEQDMNDVSPVRVTRIQELFDYTKKKIIEILLGGRELSQLSPVEQREVEKIKAIGFDNSPDKQKLGCGSSSPNAFYNPANHMFYLCKNFYNFPDSAIISVMGHEIGHAIDPCNSQFPTYRVSEDALKAIPEQEIKNDDDKFMFKARLPGWGETAIPKYTANSFSLQFKDDTVKFFESSGALSKVTDGVKPSENPFNDVLTCLNKQKGVRRQDPALVSKMAHEVSGFRAEHSDKTYNRQADEKRITATFAKHPECLEVQNKHSQMGEAFADWMGSEVLGDYLLSHPPGNSRYEKLAPFAFFASLSCAARLNTQLTAKEQSNDAAVIQAAMTDGMMVADSHPNSKKRLDDVFLQNEKVRQQLGCKDKGHSCAHQIGFDTKGTTERVAK